MIATLIAVIVANVANACFPIMIPSLIATSVLEIAYHSKQWTDYVEGYCFTSRDSAAHGVVPQPIRVVPFPWRLLSNAVIQRYL